MNISGALPPLAGTFCFASAGDDDASLTNLTGYAFPGGVFFLVSALRPGRVRNGA